MGSPSTIIATSYQGTSEKIIMNKAQLRKMCQVQVDNMIDRMHFLCADGRSDDAASLYAEIQDWVIKKHNIEVMSLDYINGQFESY